MSGIEISKKLVLINSASSAVALVLNLSVLVWLQQYLLKRISPEEYALIPLLMAVMAFAPLLSMVLTGGLGRFITVAYARGDTDEITRICSTMFPLLLGAGVAFWAIGWLGVWHIDKLLDIPPDLIADARLMMALLVFSAGLRLPLAVFGSGFIVRQKLMLQDMIDVGCQLLRIVLLFALLFGIGTSVLWVTVALVVSELVNMVIATPISIRLVPAQRIRRGYLVWSKAKELTSYGGWGLLNQIGETLKQAMDPIILNRFASAVDVSVFYVAGILPRQMKLILTPLSRPFIPILAAMYANGETNKLRNTYLRANRYHSWVLLLVAVPGVVFCNEIVRLYLDGKYADAAGVMALLMLVVVLNGFNSLGPAIAAAIGDMRGIASRMLIVQVVNLMLTIYFVAFLDYGSFGAAFASLLAVAIIESILVWTYCRKIVGVSIKQWTREVVAPSVGSAIPYVFICVIAKLYLADMTWVMLFNVVSFGGIIYLCTVVIFGLRPQDRIDIGRVAEKSPAALRFILKKISN